MPCDSVMPISFWLLSWIWRRKLSLFSPFCMQGQTAAVSSMHVLVKTKKKLFLGQLKSNAVGCAQHAMLKAQPELAQLEWCLRIMLADYPAIPPRLSQESFMTDLPNFHRGMVRSSTTPSDADFWMLAHAMQCSTQQD